MTGTSRYFEIVQKLKRDLSESTTSEPTPANSTSAKQGKTSVLILGLPGSGKTTLAKILAKELDLKHLEVDRFFWRDDRTENSIDVLQSRLQPELDAGNFIVEGHFKTIRSLLVGRISKVIWIDPPIAVVLYRCLSRELNIGGIRQVLDADGTFRFLLKNYRKLREMQASAFHTLVENEKVQGYKI